MLALYKREEVLPAHPLEWSAPLQWLLSSLTNPTAAAVTPARLKPESCRAPDKRLRNPPLPACPVPRGDVALRGAAPRAGRWLFFSRALGIGSKMRCINSLYAFFWHCKNRSYINIFCEAEVKLVSSVLLLWLLSWQNAFNDSIWQLMNHESEGSLALDIFQWWIVSNNLSSEIYCDLAIALIVFGWQLV